ncbi:MAG: glycosyltransferase family 2 protein [bacterium]
MLSIIIPTFQEEKYLGRLLESIKKQTLQPDEIIIADNHSKDRTREIAKEYGCIIVDGGIPSEGRNAGAKTAKGDLLLFLDADNVITKRNFIEKFIKSFEKRKLDIATTFVTLENINIKSLIVNLGFSTSKIVNELLLKHLKKVSSESGACILMKKDLFLAAGMFDENMYVHEDSELFQKVTKQGARYGLVAQNINTSDRRLQKMDSKIFSQTSLFVVYAFFRRFFGFKDNEKFIKKYEKMYGRLGGEE